MLKSTLAKAKGRYFRRKSTCSFLYLPPRGKSHVRSTCIYASGMVYCTCAQKHTTPYFVVLHCLFLVFFNTRVARIFAFSCVVVKSTQEYAKGRNFLKEQVLQREECLLYFFAIISAARKVRMHKRHSGFWHFLVFFVSFLCYFLRLSIFAAQDYLNGTNTPFFIIFSFSLFVFLL